MTTINPNPNNPSICIPRVYSSINKKNIYEIFQTKLGLGSIKKIDMINTNDINFKKVFIHFHSWNINDNVTVIKEKFLLGKIVKIVYDFPWFWKCSIYRPSL